jgi:hypothetical protein
MSDARWIGLLLLSTLAGCPPQTTQSGARAVVTIPPPSTLIPDEEPAPQVAAAPPAEVPETPIPDDLKALSTLTVDALARNDMALFARVVHPKKGVRFSPYSFVEAGSDVELHNKDIQSAFLSPKKRLWGSWDGSGDPIQMTFKSYLGRFVNAAKMSRAKEMTVNRDLSGGNTTNNAREIYPRADIVEIYLPARPEVEMDWQALRLVFERFDGHPRLIGIIHNEWTI